MLLSTVSVLVVAQSSSEIPEGLMNNTVVSCVLKGIVINEYQKSNIRSYGEESYGSEQC